jgi:hypothetical protein
MGNQVFKKLRSCPQLSSISPEGQLDVTGIELKPFFKSVTCTSAIYVSQPLDLNLMVLLADLPELIKLVIDHWQELLHPLKPKEVAACQALQYLLLFGLRDSFCLLGER